MHFDYLLLASLDALSVTTRFVTIGIIGIFMPLTAITFVTVLANKREKDFLKAQREMKIQSSRSIWDVFRGSQYILPVLFATVITALGISIIMFPTYSDSTVQQNLLFLGSMFGSADLASQKVQYAQSLSAASYAFMGSFLWSSQSIIRRMIAYDLMPNVYYSAGIRIILAVLVSVLLAFVVGSFTDLPSSTLASSMPVISLLAGIFPDRVINLFIQKFDNIFNAENRLNTKTLALDNIEGMSLQHQERLVEAGIDNAENLAASSVTRLLVETPYEARQLLDWIGQAKLLVYAKDNIQGLRQVGIRSAYDLYTSDKNQLNLTALAHIAGISPVLLLNIWAQIRSDEGTATLNYFHECMDNPAAADTTIRDVDPEGNPVKVVSKRPATEPVSWTPTSDTMSAPGTAMNVPALPNPTAPNTAGGSDGTASSSGTYAEASPEEIPVEILLDTPQDMPHDSEIQPLEGDWQSRDEDDNVGDLPHQMPPQTEGNVGVG